MRILLDECPHLVNANTKLADKSGETPLLALLRSSEFTVEDVTVLLHRGADVHARDSGGFTCLHRYLGGPLLGYEEMRPICRYARHLGPPWGRCVCRRKLGDDCLGYCVLDRDI